MKRGDKKGFTIIEVSLVLAIAGLIFLMIFIALPALRRTQRDSARRDDIMVFLRKVKDYQTNNRGALPIASGGGVIKWSEVSSADTSSWGGFFRDYLGEDFVDPDGVHYNLAVASCRAQADADCSESEGNGFFSDLGSQPFGGNGDYSYSIIVVTQATCSGDKVVGTTNPRKIAALYRLEGAGAYCANT